MFPSVAPRTTRCTMRQALRRVRPAERDVEERRVLDGADLLLAEQQVDGLVRALFRQRRRDPQLSPAVSTQSGWSA